MVFRCLILRERQLQRNGNCLVVFKLVEVIRVLILLNSRVVFDVYMDKKFFYYKVLFMLQFIFNFCIFFDLDVILFLYYYDYDGILFIFVEIINVIIRIVLVFFKVLICEMQLVYLVELLFIDLVFSKLENILDKINIGDLFIDEEIDRCRSFIGKY